MGGERSIDLHGRSLGLPLASLPRSAAVLLLGLLMAVALMVVARRLAGALANPLEPAPLLITGLLVAAVAAVIRLGWRAPPTTRRATPLDWAVMALTSLAVAALGAGLCLPETSSTGLFLLCTVLAAEESWAWAWYIRRCGSPALPRPSPLAPRPSFSPPTLRTVSSLDSDVAALPEDVTQQLTRSQAADGTETLSGWLRMAFAAGQRTGNVHVAFCPPFAATPELEVEQLDGPETRIKTAQLLSYGARLDLKLAAAADEPTSVLLQFSARTGQAEK
jgi:hypothetical protein